MMTECVVYLNFGTAANLNPQLQQETFRLLDDHLDKRLTYEDWLSSKHRLPKMYNKVMSIPKGVLYQYTSMFRADVLEN